MTPKEKAIELFAKMYTSYQGRIDKNTAKQCALIAVNEVLNNFGPFTAESKFYVGYNAIEFYKEVKQEIEKL